MVGKSPGQHPIEQERDNLKLPAAAVLENVSHGNVTALCFSAALYIYILAARL